LVAGETSRFVTCIKCTARLEVKRSATAVYTDVLDAEDVDVLKKELKRLDEVEREHADQSTPAAPGETESILRVVIGLILIASDLYWWFTDPSMQSLYVRILLLAAGVWMIVSGLVKMVAGARAKLRARASQKAAIDSRRLAIKRTIETEKS
jgi:hypothetical protein